MWKDYSNKGYYYDEEEDITYINNDRLTEEEMVELIGILGFMLDTFLMKLLLLLKRRMSV